MKTTLVVLFLINGAWVTIDGWGEREATTEEECETWVERVDTYLNQTTVIEHKVYCE